MVYKKKLYTKHKHLKIKYIASNSIAVFSYPLPSPTNYALLASLVTILSYIYKYVIVITGNFIENLPNVSNYLELSNKKAIYIFDIRCKLPPRNSQTSLIIKLFIYLKIQVNLLVAILKLHSIFDTVIFFIGISHMLFMLIFLRLLKKKIVLY